MTTKEKIAVMQAWLDGKTIQYKDKDEKEWLTWDESSTFEPVWAWIELDYRIKPEPKIRPYTFKEMCEAVKKHGSWIWQGDDSAFSIGFIDNEGAVLNYGDEHSYKELLDEFCWLDDNTPCGIVEK